MQNKNLMGYDVNKFEQMSHGHTEDIIEGTYEAKSGKENTPKKTIKDLEMLISKTCLLKRTL